MPWVQDNKGKWIWAGTGPQIGGPPQVQSPETTPPVVVGGGGGGARRTPPSFNLPPEFEDMLTQGGQYEIPWDQQLLLAQQAYAGADPGQIQTFAGQMFTPERWAQLQGIDISPATLRAQRGRIRMPGGMGYNKIPGFFSGWSDSDMARAASEFISSFTPYQDWRKGQTQQFTSGVGGRQSGFLPDKEAYMAELQGTLTDFAAELGIRREAFQADVAGRGVGPGGAGTSPYYQDVVAPVMRAGAQAVRGSFLDYLKAYQQGSMFEEGIRQESISRLTSTGMQAEQIRTSNRDLMLRSYLGEAGTQLGYEGLNQQQRQFGVEMSMRSYENKMEWYMHQYELQQRERESKRNFWSNFFGSLFQAGGEAAGVAIAGG